ncbi:MAG: type II secretion system F family protein [Thermaerobacter sp.]|nr:type II secretion system F family protein [Thermaerobacter sp.]
MVVAALLIVFAAGVFVAVHHALPRENELKAASLQAVAAGIRGRFAQGEYVLEKRLEGVRAQERSYLAREEVRAARAGLAVSGRLIVGADALLAVAVFAATAVLFGNPVAALMAAVLGWMIPEAALDWLTSWHGAKYQQGLEASLDTLANMLHGKAPFRDALARAAQESHSPAVREDLRALLSRWEREGRFAPAVEYLAWRRGNAYLQALAVAVTVAEEHGGDLSAAVVEIARTARRERAGRAGRRASSMGQALTLALSLLIPVFVFFVGVPRDPAVAQSLRYTPSGRFEVDMFMLLEVGAVVATRILSVWAGAEVM